jgi:hypothetical protein
MGFTRCFRPGAGLFSLGIFLAFIPTMGAGLDQRGIHAAYNDGDFENALKSINQFTTANKTYSHADSLFLFKHLAVMYTANPKTLEKGKYFMFRMLEIQPSADLVDMFVSDEMDRTFEKVRKEFTVRQKNSGVDSTQIALSDKTSTQPVVATTAPPPTQAEPRVEPKRRSMDPVWFWVAGGAVAVGAVAAVAATILLMQPEDAQGKTFVVAGN